MTIRNIVHKGCHPASINMLYERSTIEPLQMLALFIIFLLKSHHFERVRNALRLVNMRIRLT